MSTEGIASKVITLVSTKGSVGKTALAIHIGGYLASQGKKVCFIDADYLPAYGGDKLCQRVISGGVGAS